MKKPSDVFELPIKTKEELEDLNMRVFSSPDDKDYLITYFSDIGGKHVGDKTRRICKRVFHQKLAAKFNITGTKSKFALREQSSLFEAIKDAICQDTPATEREVETYIANWLTSSRDRPESKKNQDNEDLPQFN